ncbi:MAG: hypothetical protein ACD_15C00137G0002 [uncultured bacterium]|nr:MAG: hypothetical protein ACD_15C00137G0002 [uncultured bacterium]
MELTTLEQLLTTIKKHGEIPYIEVKDSLLDKEKIGQTLSALSNSASFHNQEYGYMIWGIENSSWNVKGTKFDIEKAKQGKSGFIYHQIIKAFNYPPEILLKEFLLSQGRVYVIRIKNCGNNPLSFVKIPYIRSGEVNDELHNHPIILKEIVNKNVDWSAQTPKGSCMEWIDEKALEYLRIKYLEINENREKQLDNTQLLNTLSLLGENDKPNNTCLLFIGKPAITKKIFVDRSKLTWVYRDELNGIEERLLVDEESMPLIFSIQNVFNKINKFNTTLSDIDLFRNDVSQYDAKVIEEMTINAVAHRDWTINFWIEIVQTPTSLEIRNPGKFRADLDKVLRENKRPEYLNPTLVDFLKKIHLMEKEGGGLKKAYTIQIKKGLKIVLHHDNESPNPRVDFILTGKVSDIVFARLMFTSKDLTQDQVVILDKINSNQNILNKDVTKDEFDSVRNLVTKTGQGGAHLKIKEHLLKKSKNYISNFSNTHASVGTSKEIILDYAKKNSEFTTAEIYDVMSGKSEVSIRILLMQMVKNNVLERKSRGIYRLVANKQTKRNINKH